MKSPTIKLRTSTSYGTEESPRGSLVNLDELLTALNAASLDYESLIEELKEQAEHRKNAINYYKD